MSTGPSLSLLGGATLAASPGEPIRLERKTAGLLAYLALEGPTPRQRLAGLLWPEAAEATARNNLSQALRRLRELAGAQPVAVGQDPLDLAATLHVDAVALVRAHVSGDFRRCAQLRGELLAGYDFDECADFSHWLESRRARLVALRREALSAVVDELERAGDYRGALGYARQLIEADPLSELSRRQLMRLYYFIGDRGSALAVLEECRAVLRRELNVEPMPETLALGRTIQQGAGLTESVWSRPRALPESLLRPPLLVDRDELWARMEAAWQRNQPIFLAGAAGVGKTRLMQDFLGAKGRFFSFDGRPDDVGVPYATHGRTYRDMLRAFPGIVLPDWVRRELARILPELGDPPPPFASETDKLRFYQAKAEATRRAVEAGMQRIAVDDLQYVDLASLEAGHFVYAQEWGRPGGMRTVICFREHELAPQAQAALRAVVESGKAVLLQVEPLAAGAVREMLATLNIDLEIEPHSERIAKFTGGNPLYVLEAVKSLLEAAPAANGIAGRLPTSGRINALINQRLERLSPAARNLARVAALAGSQFSADLAVAVLGAAVQDLADPWTELEAAQILTGTRFSHDILHEAVLASIPDPIRTYLERRIAEVTAG